MLLPKNTKYRKQHKGRIHGNAKGNYELTFGYYGLKSLNAERVTAKPAEVRMGKGKGSIDRWVCRVKPGTIMFEVDGVDKHLAKKAFELASAKLPVKTTFVSLDQF